MKQFSSTADLLRQARHDHLNDLQLVKMYLDLGKPERVTALIQAAAKQADVWRRLSAMNLPKTEEWLLLAEWRFPELKITVECVASAAPQEMDGAISEIAESVMTKIRENLKETDGCACTIRLSDEQGDFRLVFSAEGVQGFGELPEVPGIRLMIEEEGNLLRISANVQMEG